MLDVNFSRFRIAASDYCDRQRLCLSRVEAEGVNYRYRHVQCICGCNSGACRSSSLALAASERDLVLVMMLKADWGSVYARGQFVPYICTELPTE